METSFPPEETMCRLDELLTQYEESWNRETEIFLDYLQLKKQEDRRISSLQKEIEETRTNEGTLSEQLRNNHDRVKQIYHILKVREALYETRLKCRLSYESINVYQFSFVSTDSSVASWIRFKHDPAKNRWTVLEIQPANSVPETIIEKFHESQDTQSLLCYFRTRL